MRALSSALFAVHLVGAAAHTTRLPMLQKVDLSEFPEARCLDESPAAYWYRPAQAASAKKWIIYIEGGGECISDADCSSRRSTYLGSSADLPESPTTLPLVLSDLHQHNPDFADWNHVLLHYCTGDLHIGNMTTDDVPQWGWARFRGHQVLEGVVKDLDRKFGLPLASTLILAGESAGGIATFAHLDWIDAQFPDSRVIGLPVAGFYWNNDRNFTGPGHVPTADPFTIRNFEDYYHLWKMFVPQACAAANPNQPWVCALANFSFPTLHTPVFVVEALVDKVQLLLHSGLETCLDNREEADFCHGFGQRMTAALQQVKERADSRPDDAGLFAPSCFLHTGFGPAQPLMNGMSYVQAFGDWLVRGVRPHVQIDDCCSTPKVVWNPTCPDSDDTALVV